jgi:hypothetical protein
MAGIGTASSALGELAEFALFSREEQRYIERALDLTFGEVSTGRLAREGEHVAGLRERHATYRELRALRFAIPQPGCLSALDGFMGMLLRASAQDLSRGSLGSFAAFRFLYERLMGAAVRPWLPAAFCGAAALPQIHPGRRKALLSTLTEAAATAEGWSDAEPSFFPRTLDTETA